MPEPFQLCGRVFGTHALQGGTRGSPGELPVRLAAIPGRQDTCSCDSAPGAPGGLLLKGGWCHATVRAGALTDGAQGGFEAGHSPAAEMVRRQLQRLSCCPFVPSVPVPRTARAQDKHAASMGVCDRLTRFSWPCRVPHGGGACDRPPVGGGFRPAGLPSDLPVLPHAARGCRGVSRGHAPVPMQGPAWSRGPGGREGQHTDGRRMGRWMDGRVE